MSTTPSGKTRILTGLKPTGEAQLGNYLGAIRPLVQRALDPQSEVFVCVADLHALTVEHHPRELRARSLRMAAMLLACGIGESVLFLQSSVPAHSEMGYLLESTATYGEMARMVQFREKSRSGGSEGSRVSLLTYPALMAGDILLYQSSVVPVGEDQKQHLELARVVAQRFNSRYGEVFTVPRGEGVEKTRVKDLRAPSEKMGKSGAESSGVIFLADDEKSIRSKVKRAVTDSDPALTYDPEGRPGVANLARILGALSGVSPEDALYGMRGSGELKGAVSEAVVREILPVQERYREILADEEGLLGRLREGRERVRDEAGKTLQAAQEAMGLLRV